MARRPAFRAGTITVLVGALAIVASGLGPASAVASVAAGPTSAGPVPAGPLAAGELPIGEMAAGEASREVPTTYSFVATEPGRLTVAVRAQGTVEIVVSNAADGELTDGRGRVDVRGQLAVDVYAAGEYVVTVTPAWPDTVAYFVGASFVPWRHAAAAPDPDGGPDRALAISAGESVTDEADEPDDRADWIMIHSAEAGVLMIDVEPLGEQTAELSVQIYRTADLFSAVGLSRFGWSDGTWRAEPAWLPVIAGETVAVRLSSWFGAPTGYRLVSASSPDPDGTPETAVPLPLGETIEDAAAAPGDLHDWYLVTPDAAGRLTVDVEPLDAADPALDLQLLLYVLGADDPLPSLSPFGATVSANSFDDAPARETGTVDVAVGQRVLVRVDTRSIPLPAGQYRLTTSWEAA